MIHLLATCGNLNLMTKKMTMHFIMMYKKRGGESEDAFLIIDDRENGEYFS